MDRQATPVRLDPAVTRFAARLRDDVGATRVLLFGSQARGNAWHGSDYDFMVVSPKFTGITRPLRGLDLRKLWYEAGGTGPIDIICLSPEEFGMGKEAGGLIADVFPGAVDVLPLTNAVDSTGPIVLPERSFTTLPVDVVAYRFASALRDSFEATRVLLYGPYARGTAYKDSQYDFIVVSSRFEGVERAYRGLDLWRIWYEAGGRAPMNILPLTPDEFEAARTGASFVAAVLPESIDLLAPDDTSVHLGT